MTGKRRTELIVQFLRQEAEAHRLVGGPVPDGVPPTISVAVHILEQMADKLSGGDFKDRARKKAIVFEFAAALIEQKILHK